MVTKKKPIKKKSVGTNVRFTESGYNLLRAFCKEKGYNIGAFCEIGAMDKMKNESTENV